MTLKPTMINGSWVYAPPPPQDAEWLKRHQSQRLSPSTIAPKEQAR